jgi:hypothetical protein
MRLIASPFSADDYDDLVTGIARTVRPMPGTDDLVLVLLAPGDDFRVLMVTVIEGCRSGLRDDPTDQSLRNLAWILAQVEVDRVLLLTYAPSPVLREDDVFVLHRLRSYSREHGVDVIDLLVVCDGRWCSVEGLGQPAA